MKKTLIGIVAGVIAILGSLFGYNQIIGNANTVAINNVAGNQYQLCKLPFAYVFAASTSTTGYTDGCLVQQEYASDSVKDLRLSITAIGGTATSTLGIRVMVSNDGTNYLDYSTSTLSNGTTTIALSQPFGGSFDPGVATTTKYLDLPITGSAYTRILFYGEDVATDPNDGVKAWIQLNKVSEK
jgi:hypothetical protein